MDTADGDDLELVRSQLADLRMFIELERRFAEAETPRDLVAVLADFCEDRLATLNIALLLASDDRQDLLVYQGPHPATGTGSLQLVELNADTPAGLATVTGQAAYYTDAAQVSATFPRLAQRMGGDEVLGAAAVPLGSSDEPLGAVWFRWDHPVDFDTRLIALLERTAEVLTTALTRQHEVAENEARIDLLMQTNRELQSVSAVAAHDLKAPLRRVHSFVQLLERELARGAVTEAALAHAAVIREQVNNMDRLIDDLLQYSAANRPSIELVAVELSAVIDTAERTLQPLLATEDAVIRRDVLPRVKGDSRLLGQVFANLIGNAVKYRHPDRAPVVVIDASPDSDDDRYPWWHVTVADNGIGIAEELHEKVFHIFERGDADDNEGTGIGLASVKRIMERHDGHVWVESEPDVGTTFHLRLPGVATMQTV